jgi:hypothetical protein
MKKSGEWVIDVYDSRNSASPVRPLLEKLGIKPVFHDINLDAPKKAVEKMREIDGKSETPRVYIRRVKHPEFTFIDLLRDPNEGILLEKLRLHKVISKRD